MKRMRGFSLVEVLITISIIVIVLGLALPGILEDTKFIVFLIVASCVFVSLFVIDIYKSLI